MPQINIIPDLQKISEDLISMNNLVSHLSMECSKRIKGISENLVNVIQSIVPSSELIDDTYLTEAERNELHALGTTITVSSINLAKIEERRQAIIQAVKTRQQEDEERAEA